MRENVLIREYIEKDKLDMEKITLEYTSYICKILKSQPMKLSNEDMEELISDVFLAVWKNQDKLDVNRSISIYLAGITKNLIKKIIRDTKRNDNIEDYETEIISSESIEIMTSNNEIEEVIVKRLLNMKQEDQDIFISYYYYSRNIKEISNNLNISDNKVKSRLCRIRKKLKENLIKEGYGYNE